MQNYLITFYHRAFFMMVYDLNEGWGDFEIKVVDKSNGKPVKRWLHYWGYANPHGVNTF